jgi:NADH-quinone oxidoreductase subunit M
VFAASGVVLGAAYMLYLYQRTMFGKVENPKNETLADLSGREFVTFAPLIILAVWIGIYPAPFLRRIEQSVNKIVVRVSPQYAAACGGGAPAGAAASANPAASFLAALPCGPDGKPLAPAAPAAEPR